MKLIIEKKSSTNESKLRHNLKCCYTFKNNETIDLMVSECTSLLD